jgi:toxin ParE1/3/4
MALRVAPEVEPELDEIWSYLATESGDADVADRLINSITDRFFVLSRHPYLGRRRDYDLRLGLRSLSVGGYVIIHRIEGSDVLILHVLHGRRDLKTMLRQ